MHAAKQASESGNLDEALSNFDRLLFYKPDHAAAHEMRAQVRAWFCRAILFSLPYVVAAPL
jgi:predicted Zn-dependent protease